jgi:hypothetical protein
MSWFVHLSFYFDFNCQNRRKMTLHRLSWIPVGSGVNASSDAWIEGEPLYIMLDDYNNGLPCADHRS